MYPIHLILSHLIPLLFLFIHLYVGKKRERERERERDVYNTVQYTYITYHMIYPEPEPSLVCFLMNCDVIVIVIV